MGRDSGVGKFQSADSEYCPFKLSVFLRVTVCLLHRKCAPRIERQRLRQISKINGVKAHSWRALAKPAGIPEKSSTTSSRVVFQAKISGNTVQQEIVTIGSSRFRGSAQSESAGESAPGSKTVDGRETAMTIEAWIRSPLCPVFSIRIIHAGRFRSIRFRLIPTPSMTFRQGVRSIHIRLDKRVGAWNKSQEELARHSLLSAGGFFFWIAPDLTLLLKLSLFLFISPDL
jgi:hypothetical protein